MKTLSIVVPCCNEEAVLPLFYQAVSQAVAALDVETEYVFVDDGSSDGTLAYLRALARENPGLRYVSFSRNFGKEAAIYAGMQEATGDYIVLMDADLQHPPALLSRMLESVTTGGHDSAAARRVQRKGDSPVRRMFSNAFFRLMRSSTRTDLVEGATDFRMMTRQMADAVLSMSEYNRFTKGIFGWVGFDTEWLAYEDIPRAAGETKWSMRGLVSYSLDGIVNFSTLPLSIASVLGIAFCVLSALMLIYYTIKTLVVGDPVAGFPTLICVIFLLGGIQLLCFGIMGQYIAKLYLESKKRPIFIAKERNKRI